MEKLFKLTDNNAQIKNTIFKIYEEYKNFIEQWDLPAINIDFFELNDSKTAAYISLPKKDSDVYTLNVGKDMLILLQDTVIPILYHEFTHVYDDVKLLSNRSKTAKRQLLDIYTEFHAEYISMQIATGFSSHNENKTLSINDAILNYFTNNIKDYLKRDINNYTNEFTNYQCNHTPKDYNYVKYHAIYHITKMIFSQKYIKETTDQYFSVDLFGNILGDEINILATLLIQNELDEIFFITTLKLQEMMVCKFHRN